MTRRDLFEAGLRGLIGVAVVAVGRSVIAEEPSIYSKEVGGLVELFVVREDGNSSLMIEERMN